MSAGSMTCTVTLTRAQILTRQCLNSNKCVGDDTKAAARQSLNCIKNKKLIKYGEKRFLADR